MNELKIIAVAIFGLIIGSFLSVLITRLHSEESGILTGRSHCAKCKHILAAKNLIPVFSFIFQKGKCSYCNKAISKIYPAIELSTSLLFVALIMITPNPVNFAIWASFFFVLIFIFYYDFLYQEIHDAVMIPAIIWVFILNLYLGNGLEYIYGGALGASFFALQWLISKGKWVGSGDIRIGAFIGLMLGLQLTAVALVMSYFIGSIVGIYLIASKKATEKTHIPLGPFLAVGTIITFFYGEYIIDWYFSLMV